MTLTTLDIPRINWQFHKLDCNRTDYRKTRYKKIATKCCWYKKPGRNTSIIFLKSYI